MQVLQSDSVNGLLDACWAALVCECLIHLPHCWAGFWADLQASEGHQKEQDDVFLLVARWCCDALVQYILELCMLLCSAEERKQQVPWVLTHDYFHGDHTKAIYITPLCK